MSAVGGLHKFSVPVGVLAPCCCLCWLARNRVLHRIALGQTESQETSTSPHKPATDYWLGVQKIIPLPQSGPIYTLLLATQSVPYRIRQKLDSPWNHILSSSSSSVKSCFPFLTRLLRVALKKITGTKSPGKLYFWGTWHRTSTLSTFLANFKSLVYDLKLTCSLDYLF